MILNKLLSSKNNLHNHKNADTKNSKAQSFFKKLKAPFIVLLAILTIGTVYLGFTTNQAKADEVTIANTDNDRVADTVFKKTLLAGINKCSEYFDSGINFIIQGMTNYTIERLFTDQVDSSAIDTKILLPNLRFGSSVGDNTYSCIQLFEGYSDSEQHGRGLYDFVGRPFNYTDLKRFGYEGETRDVICYYYNYSVLPQSSVSREPFKGTSIPICTFAKNPEAQDDDNDDYPDDVYIFRTDYQNRCGTIRDIFPDQVIGSCIDGEQNNQNPLNMYLEPDFSPNTTPGETNEDTINLSYAIAQQEYTIKRNEYSPPDSIIHRTYHCIFSSRTGFDSDCITSTTFFVDNMKDQLGEYSEISLGKDNASGNDVREIGTTTKQNVEVNNFMKSDNTAINMLQFFSNNEFESFGEIRLDDQETYELLEYYIGSTIDKESIYSINTDYCSNFDPHNTDHTYGVLTVNGSGEMKWCEIRYDGKSIEENSSDLIPSNEDYYIPHRIDDGNCTEETKNNQQLLCILDGGGNDFGTIVKLYNRFYNNHLDSIQPVGIQLEGNNENNYGGQSEPENRLPESEPDLCYNNNSVGWIICPILNIVSDAMSKLYDNIAENFLVISPSLVSDGSVESIFQTVINIANIVIILFLLIIIFSQLTGIGIDNYGIKKTLPKLIVVAILINVSYLLCRLLVDLSNILGYSLNEWLANITVDPPANKLSGLPDTADISSQSGWFNAIFALVAGGLVTVGGIKIVSGALTSGFFAGIILPVLILFITALFAILFFFILLGLRKAGIVILIAIAPLAILCYALPNTKKHFDKWLKAFEGLLLLYPICGVLIGGGTFISKLLITVSTDGMMYFIACLFMVIPFFFIPSLLRGSFKAMGNIGATVSGYGRRMRGWSTKQVDSGIRNSERFKNRTQFNAERRNARRAERIDRRLRNRAGGDINNLTSRQQHRLMNADTTLNSWRQKQAQATKGMYVIDQNTAERRAEASLDAQEQKAAFEEFSGMSETDLMNEISIVNGANSWYNPSDRTSQQRMAALIRVMESRGKESNVYDVLRNNDVHDSTTVMQALAGSKNYLMQAYGKKGGSMNFSSFEANSGNVLSDYIRDNDIKDADKDSIKELNANSNSNIVSNDMALSGAVNSQIPKVRQQMNQLIARQINDLADPTNLSSFKIKASDFGSMKDDTAEAMYHALIDKAQSLGFNAPGQAERIAKNIMRTNFAQQINDARANEQIKSKISSRVSELFGI